MDYVEKCQRCDHNEATEEHACPYDEELSNLPHDELLLCNCCASCAKECYWDT